MYWQLIWLAWALMPIGIIADNDYDEDFDDSVDDEEITLSPTLTPRRQRRENPNNTDRNAVTVNEYDMTDDVTEVPNPASKRPATVPDFFNFLTSLIIDPIRTSSHIPQRTQVTIVQRTNDTTKIKSIRTTKTYVTNPVTPNRINIYNNALATLKDKNTRADLEIMFKNIISKDNVTGIIPIIDKKDDVNNKPNTINYYTESEGTINQFNYIDNRINTRLGPDVDENNTTLEQEFEEVQEPVARQGALPTMPGGAQLPMGPISSQLPNMPLPVPKPVFDLSKMMNLLSNLTDDFNLTQQFNKSLQSFPVPTCPTIPTMTDEPETEDPFANAAVVSKCFVCGLTTPQIPFDAHCGDAFGGDFIPLVPVNSKAKSAIASFRKYCRYLDVPGMVEHPYEPRSIFGRFTGGCSVRWVDLTGVYTQRTCRNMRRPVTGLHFASKRMAKLEMALTGVENGCIVSPMATLLPVARSISLYARFHACVCSGEWCNRAIQKEHWITNWNIVLMITVLFILN